MRDLDDTLRATLGGDEPAADDGFAVEVLSQLPRPRRRGLPGLVTVVALGLGGLLCLLAVSWGGSLASGFARLGIGGLGGLVMLVGLAWAAVAAALGDDE